MATSDNEEFREAIKEIAHSAFNLECPYDRVRCGEWCKKLVGLSESDLESSKIRNEYIQFLKIQVQHSFLHGPFKHPPPEGNLAPLAEALGNFISQQISDLPKFGPIAPVLNHRSADGRAHVACKQIPGGGVFCYLAVSPDGLK